MCTDANEIKRYSLLADDVLAKAHLMDSGENKRELGKHNSPDDQESNILDRVSIRLYYYIFH